MTATAVMAVIQGMLSPIGFFQFLIIPFANDTGIQFLRILAFETPDTTYYQVPFEGFWGVIHLLFWCAWINLNVGIFNAIPMVRSMAGISLKKVLTGCSTAGAHEIFRVCHRPSAT